VESGAPGSGEIVGWVLGGWGFVSLVSGVSDVEKRRGD
jgi:hypothetical protein